MGTEEENDWTKQLEAIEEADKREAALYTLPPGYSPTYSLTYSLI